VKKPRPVWRSIVKKSDRQNGKLFDVLVCDHAVPVDRATYRNTYRRCRACPTCAERVRAYISSRT
jgi:hypothetical protein